MLSSFSVVRQSKHLSELKNSRSCCVLGNRLSLKDGFEKGRVKSDERDIFCVNMFCSSPLFKRLKSWFYFLVDGTYFAPQNERGRQLVEELTGAFNSVDWDMFLVISSSSVSGGGLLKSIKNEYPKVMRLNSAEINSFKSFRQWSY